MIAPGLTTHEMAARLGRAKQEIQFHVSNLLSTSPETARCWSAADLLQRARNVPERNHAPLGDWAHNWVRGQVVQQQRGLNWTC